MNPKLIINADDLAIHPSIDKGIKEAYLNGVLTSATMLMTTDFTEASAEKIVRKTGLPVGLHLSLTTGKPCAPSKDVPLLVDEDGYFSLSAVGLFRSLLLRKDVNLMSQVYVELESQFKRAEDLKISFTHFDSHQNIHLIPVIFNMLKEIAAKFGYTKARLVKESFSPLIFFQNFSGIVKRKNLIKWLLSYYCIYKTAPAFLTPDLYMGIMCSGMINKKMIDTFVKSLRDGLVYEIALHPGYPAEIEFNAYPDKNHNDFVASPSRKEEMDILMDDTVKASIERRGIELISYKELKDRCSK